MIADPVCVISGGNGWTKNRCAECAGSPVPELPPLPLADDPEDRFLRIEQMRLYALRRLTGTPGREPGQEG